VSIESFLAVFSAGTVCGFCLAVWLLRDGDRRDDEAADDVLFLDRPDGVSRWCPRCRGVHVEGWPCTGYLAGRTDSARGRHR
jgi:hypothetical protein